MNLPVSAGALLYRTCQQTGDLQAAAGRGDVPNIWRYTADPASTWPVVIMCEIFAGQQRSNYQYQTRSIRLNGQCTSVRLECKFWEILDEIADSESMSTPQFISKVHKEVMALHGETRNFSSLLRCACLVYLEQQADMAPV